MSRRATTAPFLRHRKHLIAAIAVATLATSGCSAGDSEYESFCDTSASLAGLTAADIAPDQATLQDASGGDFTALNAWGVTAEETVTEVGAKLQAASDETPDEDVSAALGTYLAMLDLIQQTAVAAQIADDVDEFTATLQELNNQASDLGDDLTEAGNVLDTTAQEHCAS